MALKGIKVNGTPYYFDYNWLNNKPIPSSANEEEGKVLMIGHNSVITWGTPESSIPSYNNADEGKVLMIDNSVITWGTPEGSIPSYDISDKDKVLMVVNESGTTTTLDWKIPENSIPSYTDDDEGKVLMVDSSGVLGWQKASSLSIENDEDIQAGNFYVLTTDTTDGPHWVNFSKNLPPAPRGSDEGYVLIAGDSGILSWMALSSAIAKYGN
jgi:hypothetical protein